MSFYATTTALTTRMPDVDFDSLTTLLVTDCITDGEAEVNKWLSRRYSLAGYQTTTAAIPPMMRTLTIRLAEGYFWQRNSRGAKESLARGRELIKYALDNLKDICDYKASLVDTAGSLIPTDENAGAFRVLSSTTDFRDTFNEGKSSQWKVDRDKLDEIDDGNF